MQNAEHKKLIMRHVSHPACLTLDGARAHVEYMPEISLTELWELCYAFEVGNPDKLPQAIWKAARKTKCGRLLN